MLSNTAAMAFLEEKLNPADMEEFKNLLGKKGVGTLIMHMCSIGAGIEMGRYTRRKPTDRGYIIRPNWRDKSVPTFPSEERVLELANQYFPLAEPEILEMDPSKTTILLRLAGGTEKRQRQRFVHAITNETYFTQ